MGAWNLLYWLAWGKNRLIDSGDALVVLTRKQETTINWEEISAIHWHSGDYSVPDKPALLTPPRVDIELRIRPEVVSSGGFLLWFPQTKIEAKRTVEAACSRHGVAFDASEQF